MLVSIIIPAYREESTIQKDIRNVCATMDQTRWDYEVAVVVDGSADSTFEKASELAGEKVRVFGYEENRGKGYAVRFGMARARGDWIAFVDAGMEINPNGISMLLEHMTWYDADVVVGSKRHPASKTNLSWLRKVYSEGYYWIVKTLFGLRVRDTQVGLKVYRREVLERVLPRMVVKAYAFDIELLAVARHLGFKRICEAPVEMDMRFSQNKLDGLFLFFNPNIRGMLLDTVAIFYRLFVLRYYDDKNSQNWEYVPDLHGLLSEHNFSRFSVIIPIRKINKFLQESISHLEKLDYPNFEVIVVADYKSDYELEDPRFKFIVTGSRGPGEKRNIGAKYATGDTLAFLDDDAYPSKDWLFHAAKIFENKTVYALGAPAVTPTDAPFFERISGRVLETRLASAGVVYRHIPQKRRLINDYPTVNLFVRKQNFLEVSGFTEEFWPGEETKLCLDLVKTFGKDGFIYDPHPIVFHHRRELFWGHFDQVSRYGRHRGQFARVFPENSRLPSYFVPSFFVLGLVLGPFVSLLIPRLWALYFGILLLYMWLLVLEGAWASFKDKELKTFPYVILGIFLTHLVYGVNFIIGYLKRPELKLRGIDLITGNYVGG